jgi:23S rRNA (guanosine2251-2'-O)-methyltransferase
MPHAPQADSTHSGPGLKNKVVLVLGSEGTGLRRPVSKACEFLVRVPSFTDSNTTLVDSLNVGVAGGVMLWHLRTLLNQA